jgi:hypothetical protein
MDTMYISTDARRVRTDIMYGKKNEREREGERGTRRGRFQGFLSMLVGVIVRIRIIIVKQIGLTSVRHFKSHG